MKEIYNEGRVVGLSQYELYVRQLLSTNPEATPMSEREWLADTISETSSMILRIPAGTTAGYHDYPLPEGSQLCAATVVYGSIFRGGVALDDSGFWATHVIDYGELISNNHLNPPVTPGLPSNVPTKSNLIPMPESYRKRCMNYLKVISGLIIQPGEWVDNTYYTPLLDESSSEIREVPIVTEDGETVLVPQNDVGIEKSLDPDFSKQGFVRLLISEDIDTDVLIFLHGFMNSVLLQGESGLPVYGLSDRPQDGDFLGPGLFPWSCPIVFISTSDVTYAQNITIKNEIARIDSRLDHLAEEMMQSGVEMAIIENYLSWNRY